MNPFYNGTAKKAVENQNPDVPSEMQEHHPGTDAPMTEMAGGDMTFDNSLGKELSQQELDSEKKTNFFVGQPVFHPI